MQKDQIRSDKIFILLNNTWGNYKKEYIKKIYRNYQGVDLISQNKINNIYYYSEFFDFIPDNPLACGLQGLQRATLLKI